MGLLQTRMEGRARPGDLLYSRFARFSKLAESRVWLGSSQAWITFRLLSGLVIQLATIAPTLGTPLLVTDKVVHSGWEQEALNRHDLNGIFPPPGEWIG